MGQGESKNAAEQQIREGMTWEPIEEAKAKQRKINAQNARWENIDSENFHSLEKGRMNDIIARRIGLGSGVTYEKGKSQRWWRPSVLSRHLTDRKHVSDL